MQLFDRIGCRKVRRLSDKDTVRKRMAIGKVLTKMKKGLPDRHPGTLMLTSEVMGVTLQ